MSAHIIRGARHAKKQEKKKRSEITVSLDAFNHAWSDAVSIATAVSWVTPAIVAMASFLCFHSNTPDGLEITV